MTAAIEPFHFGPPGRELFGAFHPAKGDAQAAVLMCPPLLHEHARSYRFFAGVAGLLSEAGLACLRFDYRGTGDSWGDSMAFTPDGAISDIALAADVLRERTDGAPLILMGVRASSLLVQACALDLFASSVWLWQPVADAAAYLRQLAALDAAERASQLRYPFARQRPAAGPHEVMGFELRTDFSEQLLSLDSNPGHGLPVALVEGVLHQGPAAATTRIELSAVATDWVDQVELEYLIPVRDARDAVAMLASDLATWA